MRESTMGSFVLALMVGAILPAGASAAAAKEAEAATRKDGAYTAELTDFEYPFEVKFHPLEAQRQRLRMAFMDVGPSGAGNGRTVALLHGKNFSGAYWQETIRALSSAGYRVVVPDQIGFGKSSKPTAFQYTLHALASHTRSLLDALGVGKASVVGHSMGGMLATRFALMYPERVDKLALVNPIGLEDWKRWVPYRPVTFWYRNELTQNREEIREYMRNAYFAGEWKPEYEPLIEILAGWTEGPDHEQIAYVDALTFDMIFTQPVLYELGDLTMPTLLIIGQRDRTAPGRALAPPEVRDRLGDYPTLGKRAAAAIPDATLVELPGVGHLPQVEAFETYRDALLDFLR